MKRITVIISRRASKEIDEAALWWADRGEPTFIDDAIDKVVARLQAFPKSAPVVEIRGKWSDTHRASVDRGYQLYYRYNERARTIVVRCFWHERRRPPRL